jgi:hypothetical protein
MYDTVPSWLQGGPYLVKHAMFNNGDRHFQWSQPIQRTQASVYSGQALQQQIRGFSGIFAAVVTSVEAVTAC